MIAFTQEVLVFNARKEVPTFILFLVPSIMQSLI
jgi:hypothetical protein